MPPQSAIGVQQSDGTIKAIMLYNDDRRSPAHVILSGWYNSQKQAEELLALGHLSRLGEKIAPEFGEHHSFDKPQPNTVIAYHRDRGDAVEPYFIYKNAEKKELIFRINAFWLVIIRMYRTRLILRKRNETMKQITVVYS